MRNTRQRQAILATLRDQERPLTPAEITEIAGTRVQGLNLATVYRNLKGLTDNGEVSAVECVGQPSRYELAGLDHHHHFHCTNCDRLFDLPGCRAKGIESIAPEGFVVEAHHIQLSGLCSDCAES